jgi:aminocarboxymuconate-semialdehyde decarboxylase
MPIDMHAHWVPSRLISESAAGRDWYGWRILHDQSGAEYIAIGDRVVRLGVSKGTLADPQARAASRKADGVDFEALMLLGSFWNDHLDEADAVRCSRELNEEVAAVQSAFPDRYCGMAVLPMQHQKAALRELDYACGHLGLRTIATATNVRGLNLDEPAVLPVLEAAAAKGLSICVHPPVWDKAGDDRFPRYHFKNSFGAPLESSLAAMSIVYSGLLDRHPDLRIMFTQGGGPIHFGVGRLDHRYRQRADARPMAHPPGDYLKRMYFDCLVHDEDSLALLAKRAGTDRILAGTDFPATGDIPGGAMRWIGKSALFTDDDKEKILWRNALAFLGVEKAGPYARSAGAARAPSV